MIRFWRAEIKRRCSLAGSSGMATGLRFPAPFGAHHLDAAPDAGTPEILTVMYDAASVAMMASEQA
jgi:hypothetical protein